MFKGIILAMIFSFCFFIELPGGFSNSTNLNKENEIEIIDFIKKAVEDTSWLYVSSRQEMDRVLVAYYTGPLLLELSESTWNFISVPTDWDYVAKAENIKIIEISGNKASACVDILENDSAAGVTLLIKAEYLMIKTEDGWKIAGANYYTR